LWFAIMRYFREDNPASILRHLVVSAALNDGYRVTKVHDWFFNRDLGRKSGGVLKL